MTLKEVDKKLKEIRKEHNHDVNDINYFLEQFAVLDKFVRECMIYKQNCGDLKIVRPKEKQIVQFLQVALGDVYFYVTNHTRLGSVDNCCFELFDENGNLRIEELDNLLTVKHIGKKLAEANERNQFISLENLRDEELEK